LINFKTWFYYQVVEIGGVQTLIFLGQSGNDEVKVSDVVFFEKLIIETYKKIDALAIYTPNKDLEIHDENN